MKDNRRCFFVFLLLALFVFLPWRSLAEPPAPLPPKDGVWAGHLSNQKDVFIKVVDTRKEWSELWGRAFDKPAPEIDFEKKVVACVFLGYSADWLYSIYIGEPVRRDQAWVVSYELVDLILELVRPFKASGQYAMKVLEKKKDAPMILEKDTPDKLRR